MGRAGVRIDPTTGHGVSAFSVSADIDYESNADRPGLMAKEVPTDHPAIHEPARWMVGPEGTLTRRPDDPPPPPRPDTRTPLLLSLDVMIGDSTLPVRLRTFAQRLKEHLG